MNKRIAWAAAALCSMSFAPLAWATGPYEAYIDYVQTTDVGNPYNTVFLQMNISNSPCLSTNEHDRFTITTKVQQAALLAAVMGGKKVRIFGTGACNSADIEEISNVQLYSAQ